jgi:thiamine-phosphate pyrophosphorylase
MAKYKPIAKLQFITVDHPTISHAHQAIRAYKAGCKWVQLRMKEASEAEIEAEIEKILPIANAHSAILLINDNAALALKTGAHGVHLGKSDMTPLEARQLLGFEFIIGGTANTFEDVMQLIENGVDYIGLGPFRFTTTKKKLSPTLGLEGYASIFKKMEAADIHFPIVAIGGIQQTDLPPLKTAGVQGIALAGAILKNNEIESNIQLFQQII